MPTAPMPPVVQPPVTPPPLTQPPIATAPPVPPVPVPTAPPAPNPVPQPPVPPVGQAQNGWQMASALVQKLPPNVQADIKKQLAAIPQGQMSGHGSSQLWYTLKSLLQQNGLGQELGNTGFDIPGAPGKSTQAPAMPETNLPPTGVPPVPGGTGTAPPGGTTPTPPVPSPTAPPAQPAYRRNRGNKTYRTPDQRARQAARRQQGGIQPMVPTEGGQVPPVAPPAPPVPGQNRNPYRPGGY